MLTLSGGQRVPYSPSALCVQFAEGALYLLNLCTLLQKDSVAIRCLARIKTPKQKSVSSKEFTHMFNIDDDDLVITIIYSKNDDP